MFVYFVGNYTIQVQEQSSEYSPQQFCSDEQLPLQNSLYNRAVTCNRLMYGDVIIINRTSSGYLKLCDFKLKGIVVGNNFQIELDVMLTIDSSTIIWLLP